MKKWIPYYLLLALLLAFCIHPALASLGGPPSYSIANAVSITHSQKSTVSFSQNFEPDYFLIEEEGQDDDQSAAGRKRAFIQQSERFSRLFHCSNSLIRLGKAISTGQIAVSHPLLFHPSLRI